MKTGRKIKYYSKINISLLFILFCFTSLINNAEAQVHRPLFYQLDENAETPLANDIIDIIVHGNALWFGNGRGLSVTRNNLSQ